MAKKLECGCEIEGDTWFIAGSCKEHGFGKAFTPTRQESLDISRFDHDA